MRRSESWSKVDCTRGPNSKPQNSTRTTVFNLSKLHLSLDHLNPCLGTVGIDYVYIHNVLFGVLVILPTSPTDCPYGYLLIACLRRNDTRTESKCLLQFQQKDGPHLIEMPTAGCTER